jgi:hypothetical protein
MFGIIDAKQVRQLAAAATVLVANPLTSPVDALRYQAYRGSGTGHPMPRLHLPLSRV